MHIGITNEPNDLIVHTSLFCPAFVTVDYVDWYYITVEYS